MDLTGKGLVRRVIQSARSLRSKLMLSHLAVIFIAMMVTSLLMLSLVRGYFIETLEQSLAAQAFLLARTLFPGTSTPIPSNTSLAPAFNTVQQQQIGNLSVQVENKNPSAEADATPNLSESNLAPLNEITVGFSTALETHIRVLDDRGYVLVDSAELQDGADLSSEPSVSAALQGIESSYVQPIANQDWLFLTVPIAVQDQVLGAIVLGQPLGDIAAVLSDLRVRLLLSFAAAMPLSALVGLVLARSIARPVHTLTGAADRLKLGDYHYPIPEAGEDELGILSKVFIEMRERLRSIERMRTQFVSDVSHELRTPLTAIKGLTETLRDGAVDDPNVRDRFLASIEHETDRLIRLVNDLLILTRADSHALQLRLQNVDLFTLAATTIEKLNPEFQTNHVDLEFNTGDQVLKVNADPDRIEQVLFILLDNAIKHTPPGGSIAVQGRFVEVDSQAATRLRTPEGVLEDISLQKELPRGNWVLLSVTDTGAGIPAEDLPHVFERFYRADLARSRDLGGSGLGLSIARVLIELHGGYIWLESPPSMPIAMDAIKGTSALIALPAQTP